MLTELSLEEIEVLDQSREADPASRQSQKRLAETLTDLVHGPEGLVKAERATSIFFGAEIEGFRDAELEEVFPDVPSKALPRARLADDEGLTLVDAFAEAGLAKSKGEARRIVQQGGAYVNNRRLEDPRACLTEEHLASETVMVLRSGKRKYGLLRFE